MGSQCALLKDTTRCRQCGSNSGPLDSESDALQLCHRDPNPHINKSLWIQHDEAIGFNSVWTFNRLWLMTLLKASMIFDYVKWIPFRLNQFSLNDIWSHTTFTGYIRYSVEYEQYSNIHVQNCVETVDFC